MTWIIVLVFTVDAGPYPYWIFVFLSKYFQNGREGGKNICIFSWGNGEGKEILTLGGYSDLDLVREGKSYSDLDLGGMSYS